jgi:hypothetical protein
MNYEPDYMAMLTFDEATHTYRVNGSIVPSVTQVIPSDYSHVHPRVLEKARQRGHAVHKATELYDKGTLDFATLDPQIEPYLVAWDKFKLDYEFESDPYDVERRVYHPVDRYACTGDRPRCYIRPPGCGHDKRLAVVEVKSIAKMDLNVGLQTAGQQRAENYRARAMGIPETVDRWGVQLKSDGTYRAHHYEDKRHERVFLAYLLTVQWELAIGKRKGLK